MGGRRVNRLLLRPLLPLIAVAALVGPSTALGAGPAPDLAPAGLAPAGSALAPDPAPVAPAAPRRPSAPAVVEPAPTYVAHVFPQVVTHVVPRAAPARPVVHRTRATRPPAQRVVARKPVSKQVGKPITLPVRIVDVMPLRVDLHPGLGAAAEPLVDDAKLTLAAVALLAAVAAAASGAGLALRGRELL
jgi:hypothetical protein